MPNPSVHDIRRAELRAELRAERDVSRNETREIRKTRLDVGQASCVKRTLGGTYISVRAFHLDAYLAEQVFRFNTRAEKDDARFVATAKGADGRRLTYKALTTSHPRWR